MRENKSAIDALRASEGRLRKFFYVVTSKAKGGFAPIKENIQAHLEYLGTLEANGTLFMAGPLFNEDPDSWSGDGLLIYNVSSLIEATRIAENDPLHRSGARTFSISPWLLNDGCMNFVFRLSDQKLSVE
ncbi:MAG: YciI family protein [Pirellulales bacterium]|nr:YciI family protein [Pirellulales bacterium]